MSASLQFDQDASNRLVAMYVTPDLVNQRNQVLQTFSIHPGDRVLDVGSGPGFLASSMGDAVGSLGWVCGVDISEPLLEVAKAHCAHQPWVEFRLSDATKLPFPDNQFDIVISTQVLEYVPDVSAALKELHRVLRPAKRAVILDTDWDSIVWHSTNAVRMNRILAAWEEHTADPHLPRTLARKLRQAGFQVEAQRIIPMFNPVFIPNTFSNLLIDLITPFVTDRQGVTRDEAMAWAQDLRERGEDEEYFFSLNRYLFIAKKP
jgi:ubiquinone/menaquinone biosynthesis C-methylase UbiE